MFISAYWLGTRQQLNKLDSESLSAEFPTFLFSTSVRDLGVILEQERYFAENKTARTRSCYYHLRQLRIVSRSLSFSFFSTLVHAFIANRLDYCSPLYCGLPQVLLQPLNGVLRAAARMIGGVPKFGHISDYTRDVYSTGSQFSSASIIGSHLLSGIVFLVTRLLIFWSSST